MNLLTQNPSETRVKIKGKRKTVGITPIKLVERARKHDLNISGITEQPLYSILDFLENGNSEKGSLQNRRF